MAYLTMFFSCRNCKEKPQLEGDEIITLEEITNVRGMDPDGNVEAFCSFFNDLVPCVAGRQVWTQRERANKLIS